MQHVAKNTETLLQHGKNRAAGISGHMPFPPEPRRLFQRHVHAPMCPYVDPPPIHTRHVSIWTLMSPHMSAGSVLVTEYRRSSFYLQLTCVYLPAAAGWGLGGGRTQTVPRIMLHPTCRVSQQLEMDNEAALSSFGSQERRRRPLT